MKRIALTQGKFAIVDDGDYEQLNQHKWCAIKSGKRYYAMRSVWKKGKSIFVLMHREILNVPKGVETDHINHNGIDNRKTNLRMCNRVQNRYNTKILLDKTSQYKGVSWRNRKRKWMAYIGFNYKTIYLGSFVNEIKAAQAYDQKAKELFGEFACLNFPNGLLERE